MKRSLLFLFFVLSSTIVFAQNDNKYKIHQKGSTGFCEVGTLKAVGLNRKWQNLEYRMQNREFLMASDKIDDGKKTQIWLKNVYVDKTTGDISPIEGEIVSSFVKVSGSADEITDIDVIYYNAGRDDVVYTIEEGIKGEEFRFVKEEDNTRFYQCSGVYLTTHDYVDERIYHLNMKNYTEEQVKKQQNYKNRTESPILNAKEYLNGQAPNVTTLSVNDLFKIYNGKNLNSAKSVLSQKGYVFQCSDYGAHFWAKGGTLDDGLHVVNNYKTLSGFSRIEAQFENGETYDVGLQFFDNDKLCAYLVTKIEEMGYKAKYKTKYPPAGGVTYYFEKNPGGIIIMVSSKTPHGNSRVPDGTIEYEIMLMSPSHFNKLKSHGNVIDKDQMVKSPERATSSGYGI